MKSATIPQIRVEPDLRAQLEAVLQQGETLSEFVETSVRDAVEFRRVQAQFHERGQVAWENFQRSGAAMSGNDMLDKLQARLDAKQQQLAP